MFAKVIDPTELARRATPMLAVRQQALLATVIALLLILPCMMMGSLIPYAVILAAVIGFLVLRKPLYSILSFIVIDVVLLIHPRSSLPGAAPTAFDFALGLILTAISCYWVIRVRLSQGEPLTTTRSHLAILLFGLWSLVVTGLGFIHGNNSVAVALREFLNLSPLFILPLLFERFIEHDSTDEHRIISAVLIAGCVMVVWNFLILRSHIVQAAYLYETGRAASDEDLSGLMVLIATSWLMSRQKGKRLIPIGILFLAGCAGVVISMFRGIYIATILSVLWMLVTGRPAERKRGFSRLAITTFLGGIALFPVVEASRVFRLLLMSYSNRFLSSQHLRMDLSLRSRYVEWAYEWKAILHAPVFGYGFGSEWRVFDMILGFHSWIGFSHSSYLFLILKSGVIGFVLFFLAYFGFMLKGYRLLHSPLISETSRVIVRVGVAFLILILIDAYTEPVFDNKPDVMWVGLTWGSILAVEKSMRLRSYSTGLEPTLDTGRPAA